MNRRIVVLFCLLITLLLITGSAEAQQAKKVYRLAFLSPATSPAPSLPTASNLVPKILAESGYVEGENLLIYRRFAEGKTDRLPQLAKELVGLNSDCAIENY
jgi:putative tryptophan/tyrosine transport system substrate-binding protein